jgi:hypothetical protein
MNKSSVSKLAVRAALAGVFAGLATLGACSDGKSAAKTDHNGCNGPNGCGGKENKDGKNSCSGPNGCNGTEKKDGKNGCGGHTGGGAEKK